MSEIDQNIRSQFLDEIAKHSGLTIMMGVIVLIMGLPRPDWTVCERCLVTH